MSIPAFNEIIEPNDQSAARAEHLEKLRALVGNVYPNKFDRSRLSGGEDTITAIKSWQPVVEVEAEMAEIKANLAENERPPAEKKDAMNERLKALGTVRIAGRLTTPPRGNFVHLTDGISKLQIYCNKKGPLALIRNDAEGSLDGENGWAMWQLVDHGDFVGAEGYLFVTNTGEVSVHVEKLQFLAKAMLPMPDKMHGIADAEIRQRQRYYDLIGSSLQVKADVLSEPPALAGGTHSSVSSSGGTDDVSAGSSVPPAHAGGSDLTTREVFERRAKVISSLRRYLEDHGYVEVETPMLTPKATGAAATPFETHHNALDIKLYARIAPELYLKRLVVGGFEKVYELNRNFRNEGLSYKHNPEFTMLEFYCAYMDVNGMMDFGEELLKNAVVKATGGTKVIYQQKEINFARFDRISMKASIGKYWNRHNESSQGIQFAPDTSEMTRGRFKPSWLDDPDYVHYLAAFSSSFPNEDQFLPNSGISSEEIAEKKTHNYVRKLAVECRGVEDAMVEKSLLKVFETWVEPSITQPTFIIDYPKTISPLSKADPANPQIAERFELFINGMEVANGFSELNDPKEQYDRFVDQMSQREGGDEEAMVLDEDYIRALSYGMPPAAGIGIGIDRLVMLLTNKHSIRDVILFPHMRPETKSAAPEH